MLPEHAYGEDYGTSPVGSGPYKFVEWKLQEQILFTVNEDYYGGAPAIKNVTVVFMSEDAALAAVLAAVYILGVFLPEDAAAGSLLNAEKPPSWEHLFGTDALGRDLLMRTLKGLSVSMTVGLAASLVSAVIAVFVGIAAAAGSKCLDALVSWVIDLVMVVSHTVYRPGV